MKGRASTAATSPMNFGIALMTSHERPGFNRSNINHELCRYTDDVTQKAGLQPQQHRSLSPSMGGLCKIRSENESFVHPTRTTI
jgi:hypothetical protein